MGVGGVANRGGGGPMCLHDFAADHKIADKKSKWRRLLPNSVKHICSNAREHRKCRIQTRTGMLM